MKKIMLILALVATAQLANAQTKNPAAVKSAYESAKLASEDAKKNTKVATWIKLGQAALEAYSQPAGNAWIGASKQDLQIVMSNEKPSSVETVEINGTKYSKENYSNKAFYFNEAGVLSIIKVTAPLVDGVLDVALEAYKKASAIDEKGQKAKEIVEAVKSIQTKYTEEAYNEYSLGNFKESSVFFEKAAEASAALGSKMDGESVYNAAYTAWTAGDNARAKSFFNKSVELGYEGEKGEVYSKLADVCTKEGDDKGAKDYLELGFSKYPQSQSILVGLINYYVSKGEDTARIFELIGEAKKNDPKNASLTYVEGTIYEKLGDYENAIKSYDACEGIDPNYEYGFVGKGILLCNRADAMLEEANNDNSLTQAQYDERIAEYYKVLKGSIEPFEKAFNLTKDESLKSGIATYLKSVCFRFREESADYMAKYEMYSKIAE